MAQVSSNIIRAALYVAGGMVQGETDKEMLIETASYECNVSDDERPALEELASAFLYFGVAIRKAERDDVKIGGIEIGKPL